MARKSKDLFVILSERQNSGQPRSTREAAGGAAREVGQTVGRWMRSAVETLRPGAEEKAAKGKSRSKREGKAGAKTRATRGSKAASGSQRPALRGSGGRRALDQPLPRGLLMPGWLLVGMLIVSLGGGFVIGRYTGAAKGDEALNSSRGGNRVSAPGPLGSGVRELTAEEEEDPLSDQFYACGIFAPDDRASAAALAIKLRTHGVQNTRIRLLRKGSNSSWATLCYVASPDGDSAILADLQGLQKVLDFRLLKFKGSYLLKPD